MKISTNEYGNYGVNLVKNSYMKNGLNEIPSEQVTAEEKKFFADLYPDKSKEIMNYAFYNIKGKVSGVTIGSLFDKRG